MLPLSVFLSLLLGVSAFGKETSFAFYYGANPPLPELRAFANVVVDPDHVKTPPAPAGALPDSSDTRWLAYVAVGEVHPSRPYFDKLPKAWLLGENKAWGSRVIDQSQKEWPGFFLAKIIEPLWEAGYRGFFLDALDSYQMEVKLPGARADQEDGMIQLIRKVKVAHPDARLVLNRGFEILPEVHNMIAGVAMESLYQGWDPATGAFTEVPEEERNTLLRKAKDIGKDYGLPVISIDYVAAGDRELARFTADRIKAQGCIPWVSVPDLDLLGVGEVEVQPRRILMAYDGLENKHLIELSIHRHADPMLTYLGYVPEYWNIRQAPPDHPLPGRYAGIVCWFSDGASAVKPGVLKWLTAQAHEGIKLAFLGQFPFPPRSPFAEALGLKAGAKPKPDTAARVIQADTLMHFEMPMLPDARKVFPLSAPKGRPLLTVVGNAGDTMVAAACMPWGGYALDPFVLNDLPGKERQRWVLQPLDFLAQALQLQPLPAPDPTTENGKRLLMVHVDGDGFANKAEWQSQSYSGDILEKEILARYPFATTFSVIEGEISPTGMYADRSAELIPIARRIMALPNVEIASHTYTHPFDWHKFAEGGEEGKANHLDVKGYRFGPGQFQREISGSIDFINAEIAPEGKRCKVLLWSGNCDPDARTVGLTYAAGVANMNGGETVVTDANDSWTGIAPIGQDKGGYYQVYGPNQNENMYTKEWTGPFYGFQNVIQTFERTEKPRRFKPVDIYYHAYSGSKQASLAALKKVYDWALGQDLNNVFVSEYTPKVLDFTRIALARRDSAWEISGSGDLRELRIPPSLGYPDLRRSRGFAGFSDVPGSRYLHMTGQSRSRLVLQTAPPRGPWLWAANGRLTRWIQDPAGFRMVLDGHLDLNFTLAGARACRVLVDGKGAEGKSGPGDLTHYRLAGRHAEVSVACPR